MLDGREGKILEGSNFHIPTPSLGSSPHCCPFPPGKFPGSEGVISLNSAPPDPPQVYLPLLNWGFTLPCSHSSRSPRLFRYILEGLGTCGLEGCRGVEVRASFSSR